MPEPHDPQGDAREVEPLLQRARSMAPDDDGRLSPEARARILGGLRARRTAAGGDAGEPATAAPPPLPLRRRRWSPIGLGLALAACLALLWLVPRLRTHAPAREVTTIAHHNDEARPQVVTLADGTALWLREGATVEELGRRRIRARAGEVVVAVASDPAPFVVETAHGAAALVGEALVRAGADEAAVDVVRGHAELSQEAGPPIVARAGEEARLRAGSPPAVAPARRLSHLLAWARPLVAEAPEPAAIRRGNLLARDPWWAGEWPLPLRRLHVDVVIEGGVARTTVDQTFFNPSLRTLEGVYSFPLPVDAAISRLAMYVDGTLTEAGVVERQEGRTIYESIVYRRRDPALLEQMAGNELRLRVFPLPGRQEKRLLLSYVEPLAELYGRQSLRVPIPEIDGRVDQVTVAVRVKGDAARALTSTSHPLQVTRDGDDQVATWSDREVVLGDDLLLDLRASNDDAPPAPAIDAARRGDRWLLRVRPELGAAARPQPRRWVILHDTSASRDAGELAAQERLLGQLLRSLDPGDRVALLAFDTAVREVAPLRPVAGVDPAALRAHARQEGRAHVGATDLAAALARARAILDGDRREGEAPVILYLGDGLAQGTDQEVAALRELLGDEVVFCAAALGDAIDGARLGALADATGGLVTVVDAGEDMAWRALDLVASLATPRLVDLEVALADEGGAPLADAVVDPARRAVAEGEALIVTATSASAPASLILRGRLRVGADTREFEQRLPIAGAPADAGPVDVLWARGRVRALIAAGEEAHREAITALGLEHVLVTPFTSLLVVEDAAMARRFGLRLPREDGWARYQAPPTIPVTSEPLGHLGDPPPGAYVMRAPIPALAEPSRSYADEVGRWGLQPGDLIGLGGLGLVGAGRGGGGVGEGVIGLRAEQREAAASFGGVLLDRADLDVDGAEASAVVSAGELAEPQAFARPDAARSARRRLLADPAAIQSRGFAGRGHYRYGGAGVQPWPQAMSSSGDPRLDDLTEFIPALFESALDRERERLLAAKARVGAGSITDDARDLVERARAAAPAGRFRGPDGERLTIDRGGALEREVEIGGYLRERARFAGVELVHHYPDLDLAVRRNLAGGELLLRDRWAPWTIAAPEALAAAYVVERLGERGLRLRPPAREGEVVDVVDVELDEALRLTKIVRRRRGAAVATTTITHDDDAITVDRGGAPRVFRRDGDGAIDGDAGADAVVVDLPLRGADEAQAGLAAEAPGSPAWRRAAHQRLASLLALGRRGELPGALRLLAAAGGELRRGELVLASAAVRGLDGAAWKQVQRGLRAGDPVADYVAAIRGGPRSFAALRDRHRGTLPGLLASYRALLQGAERPRGPGQVADLAAFLAAYDHEILAYIAAWRLASGYSWTRAELAADAWIALADASPRWAAVARHAAGAALYNRGQMARAAAHFVALFDDLGGPGEPPVVDWMVRHAIQSARGDATWHLLWSRWRAHVEASGDPRHLLAFVNAGLRLGEADAIHRVLARADLGRLDLETGLDLCEGLLAAGIEAEARPVLRAIRSAAPDDPGVLIAGARVAERLGDLTQAAAALERAAESPEIVDLAELRALYRQSFELRARVSQAAVDGRAVQQAIDAALAVAARWRLEDPHNPEIDELAASLLYAHDRPDEAWRHLSSIIERSPLEGEAHARVADRLAREGDLKAADRALQEAARVEPTNPTWLLRRAQSLLAADDPAGARALLEAIDRGRWQDRFGQAVAEARGLLRHLQAQEAGP